MSAFIFNSMAKIRMVNTRFWIDDYISHLDPTEKLLFLYFLTNPYTDICGMYEIPLKNVAVDTGIDKEMVIKILNRFERDGKIFYREGWIAIKNFAKHQLDNPKVRRGIELGMEKVPRTLVDIVNSEIGYTMDSLSHLNSNLNPNSNSNSNLKSNIGDKSQVKVTFTQQGAEVIKAFEAVDAKNKTYYANKTQRACADFLVKEYGLDKVLSVIKLLSKANNTEMFPVITNPYDLKEKWVKLAAAFQKLKNKEVVIL